VCFIFFTHRLARVLFEVKQQSCHAGLRHRKLAVGKVKLSLARHLLFSVLFLLLDGVYDDATALTRMTLAPLVKLNPS
jgi:hypothetical protein